MSLDRFSNARSYLLIGAVALALGSGAASAQTATVAQTAAAGSDTGNELETVVVTSTRLQNAGFDAPTPTQVLNADALAQVAQPNIFDAVVQLPALQGSTGTTYETGSTSTGLQGLSTLSLRGFSPLRTLTLFDGERVVGSNINQTVDVSLLPQMLIQRVDVVTGGASASWGSDAVAGVVNFITDKKFNGLKSDVSYGMSQYGDNSTETAKFAAGTPFADGKGHIEIAGEYTKDDGVINEGNPVSHVGCQSIDGRTWDTCSSSPEYSNAATPAGSSAVVWAPIVQGNSSSLYGLVINGPLAGTAFSAGGTPYQFNYASGGAPTAATLASKAIAAGAVAGSGGGICVLTSGCISTGAQPGDLTNQLQPSTLVSPITRDTTYVRLSYDITPTSEVFATFNYGHAITVTNPAGAAGIANVEVPCNYAFLSASMQAACEAGYGPAGSGGAGPGGAGIANNANASYPEGGMPVGIGLTTGAYQSVNIDRAQRRFVLGGDGAFELFDRNWTWDTYAEYGGSTATVNIYNMPLKPNITAAVDSTVQNGKIQCGTVATQNSVGPVNPVNGQVGAAPGSQTVALPGCVPYDIFALPAQNSTAALQYIMPAVGPWDYTNQVQEAFGLNFNVKPVKLWAGDLSTAFGADYRLENYHAYADPYGNGSNLQANGTSTIFSSLPADPYDALYPYPSAFTPAQVSVGSSAWNAGNYHDGNGQYTVEEAYLETGIPLYKIPGWGSLDADVGGRFEHYNTSGVFYTWKLGLVWETPLPGVRIRTLESQDLRAPNLSEAFAPTTAVNSSATNPFTGSVFNFGSLSTGNPALLPESSKTQEFGVVFQPDYLRGFHASADWYRIAVSNIIGSTNSATGIINNCGAGLTQYCAQSYIATATGQNINTAACQTNPACTISTISVPLGNLASTVTDGIDFELAYQWNMMKWGVPGSFGVRALATHVYGFITCPNQAGTVCTDYAGANGYFSTSTSYSAAGGTIPTWKLDVSEQYADSWGSLYLAQRWVNAGTFSNNFVTCQIGSCPAENATQYAEYPTINYNHMPGAIYWDAGVTINLWGSKAEFYGKVNNIANLAPPPSGSFPGLQAGGVNNQLYDVIGRMYYAGFRIHL
jgi:outer membrane receptor protein involved in Fe transport